MIDSNATCVILERMVTIRSRPKYESAVNVFALPNFEGVHAHFIAIPAICPVLFPLWTIWRRFLSAMSPILMIARVRIVRNSRWTWSNAKNEGQRG